MSAQRVVKGAIKFDKDSNSITFACYIVDAFAKLQVVFDGRFDHGRVGDWHRIDDADFIFNINILGNLNNKEFAFKGYRGDGRFNIEMPNNISLSGRFASASSTVLLEGKGTFKLRSF